MQSIPARLKASLQETPGKIHENAVFRTLSSSVCKYFGNA